MVDHDDVGVLRRVATREEIAVAEAFAEFADAIVGIGVEQFPLVTGGAKGNSARSPVSVRPAHSHIASIVPLCAIRRSARILSSFERQRYWLRPLSNSTRAGMPSAATTSGMSLRTSCSWSAIVAVEITIFLPLRSAGAR